MAVSFYFGLTRQPPGFLGTGRPNTTAEFYNREHKSLPCGPRGRLPRIRMMATWVPRMPVKNPGDGSWQWVDLWNALYRERVICLGTHIDDEVSNQLLATMLYLDSVDNAKRLYIYICSPGGDITPSLSFYQTMRSLESPVSTHCLGMAYNMATFILAGGNKGYRSGMPSIRIGIAPPAGAARGQADDVENEANELIRIRDYLYSELAKNTGQPVEKIAKDLYYTKRFDADEAVEYGIIDRVYRPPPLSEEVPRKNKSAGLG